MSNFSSLSTHLYTETFVMKNKFSDTNKDTRVFFTKLDYYSLLVYFPFVPFLSMVHRNLCLCLG